MVEAATGEKIVALHEPQNEMEIIAYHKDWAGQDPEIGWELIGAGTNKTPSVDLGNLNSGVYIINIKNTEGVI